MLISKLKITFRLCQGKLVAKVVLSIQRVSGYKKPIGCSAGKDKIWPVCLWFGMGLGKKEEKLKVFEGALLSTESFFIVHGRCFE